MFYGNMVDDYSDDEIDINHFEETINEEKEDKIKDDYIIINNDNYIELEYDDYEYQ